MINMDVFRALLAMDAYNRGAGAGINVANSGLGNATLLKHSDEYIAENNLSAHGFSAQSYMLNGKTIISYRGTDRYLSDPPSGWATGLGDPDSEQAKLATDFFNSMYSPEAGGNIELVGHSLGGGLAGYVGALYDIDATLFDNMAFEGAAQIAYDRAMLHWERGSDYVPQNAVEEIDKAIYDRIYKSGQPWSPVVGNNLWGYAVEGEILATNRLFQSTPVSTLAQDAGLSLVEAHSQALLTTLLYGEAHENKAEWEHFRKYFLPHLFDEQIANAAYANEMN